MGFTLPAIVDSGADMSVFPYELMEQLGIPETKIDPMDATAASGSVDCRKYRPGVEVNVLNRRIRLDGVFVTEQHRDAFGSAVLLGRRDFFRYFRVMFDHSSGAGAFYLNDIDPPAAPLKEPLNWTATSY